MTQQRIDDPRFHGGGLVVFLINTGCFAAGLVIGAFLMSRLV